MCDSQGILSGNRSDLNSVKREVLTYTNSSGRTGTVYDALEGADVFIGVSTGDLLQAKHIQAMNKDAIILALANPTPEIMPAEALKGGAAIVGTGRSDLQNQVNNVLGFPGIFRGALDARAHKITPSMKLAAALAIAEHITHPRPDYIIPATLDEQVAYRVAKAVKEAALQERG